MFVRPGKQNSGIRFVRKDAPVDEGLIEARWDNVIDTRLSTVIGNEYGVSVSTIEHLMAAFRTCGIDNAVVEVDGPEVPIMDGSAGPFVSLFERVGTANQAARRKAILIRRPIEIHDKEKYAILTPDHTARVSVEIDFPSAAIGSQKLTVETFSDSFKHDVARARTFGFAEEIEQLQQRGLALGGSLRNAILVNGDHIVNKEGLRFKDEFVRHKVLDCVGDLALAGTAIVGHYYGHKPGHKLNHALLCRLFAERSAWSYSDADDSYWPHQRVGISGLNNSSAGKGKFSLATA